MKHISAGDFPRTQWNESAGVRSVLIRAFNTSRTSEKRLMALQSWLRFLTQRVNEALLELETKAVMKQQSTVKGALVQEEPKVEPVVIASVAVAPVALDIVIPQIGGELMDVGTHNG